MQVRGFVPVSVLELVLAMAHVSCTNIAAALQNQGSRLMGSTDLAHEIQRRHNRGRYLHLTQLYCELDVDIFVVQRWSRDQRSPVLYVGFGLLGRQKRPTCKPPFL